MYAVNIFVALSQVPLEAGPTEYLLGSHLESDKAVEQLLDQEHQAAVFEWARGTVVLMDYRTVHRGGANSLSRSRVLAMLVYGRLWWRDAVNYMGDDYGGARRQPGGVKSDGQGGPEATARGAAVVARRLAQRHAQCPVQATRDRADMYSRLRALWLSNAA